MGQIVLLEEAERESAAWRAVGRTVVFTNGHFDLLHYGHLGYLQQARQLGDALVVGLNADASTRALKGPGRPIVPQGERAALLASLTCVDRVVIFDETTAENLVAALRPQVYVKGGDWAPPGGAASAGFRSLERGDRMAGWKTCPTVPAHSGDTDRALSEPPEAAVVRAYGGLVVFLPYLAGHSTSELIVRIQSLPHLGTTHPGDDRGDH